MVRLKNHRELLTSLITRAYRLGLLSDDTSFLDRISRGESVENTYVLFLSSFADALAEYYQDLEQLIDSFDLDKAKGSDLDRLANIVGLERLEPTKSIAPVVFEKKETAQGQEMRIPAGTRIVTEKGIVYSTMYEVVIPETELQGMTYAISQDARPETRVGAGELTAFIDQIEGVTVFNPEASTGGNSKETDDELARRIRLWPFEQQRGTYTAYETALSKIPGLRDFRIVPRWDGPGTVKIIVDPPTNIMISFVEDAIIDVQTADEDVKVVGIGEKVIDIHCVAKFSITDAFLVGKQRENLPYYLEKDIRAFIDGGRAYNGQIIEGLRIGEDFNPFKLGNFLASIHPELEEVDFEYPAKKVVISDDERAKSGSVKVTIQ